MTQLAQKMGHRAQESVVWRDHAGRRAEVLRDETRDLARAMEAIMKMVKR